ncbi:parallel beta-helix [Bacillus cereus BAG2X1-3]|nr:parallel beta-helix [Bacillus cereus BAG2X1-3]
MDGGKEIIIEQNQSYENYLGIEVASEHAGKGASQITVRDNTVSNNKMSGIAIDEYTVSKDMQKITRLRTILFIKMIQKIKRVNKSN